MVLRMVLRSLSSNSRAPDGHVRAAHVLGLGGQVRFHVPLQNAPARAAPVDLGQVDPGIPRHAPGDGRGRNPAGLCAARARQPGDGPGGARARRFASTLGGAAGRRRCGGSRSLGLQRRGWRRARPARSDADVLVRLGDDGDEFAHRNRRRLRPPGSSGGRRSRTTPARSRPCRSRWRPARRRPGRDPLPSSATAGAVPLSMASESLGMITWDGIFNSVAMRS